MNERSNRSIYKSFLHHLPIKRPYISVVFNVFKNASKHWVIILGGLLKILSLLQGNLIFTYISEQNVKILITFSVSQNNIQIDISNQAKMTFDNNQYNSHQTTSIKNSNTIYVETWHHSDCTKRYIFKNLAYSLEHVHILLRAAWHIVPWLYFCLFCM